MTHTKELMRKIDWSLLQEQKIALLVMLGRGDIPEDVEETVEGVIFLIDAIQDAAIADGLVTEAQMFGTQKEV